MTPHSLSLQSTDTSEIDDTEAKVRRALGLESVASGPGHSMRAAQSGNRVAPDRPKSRFVQDGDVPIVMIRRDNGQHAVDSRSATGGSPAIRLEAAEKVLKTERHARETAERNLAEAQVVIRDLQTKLGHALLVRDEARASAQRVEIEKRDLERALAAEKDARQTAERHLPDVGSETQSESGTRSRAAAIVKPTANALQHRRSAKLEPKPVQWWIKPKQASGHPA